MLDAVEPMNDAAWTQWKALHHQTKDLSPWLTEDTRAEHLRVSSHGAPPASSSKHALTQIWTSVQQRRWKVLAVIAAICRFDTFHPAMMDFHDLAYLLSFKYIRSSGYPCLSTSKTATEGARAGACTSARNRNVQRLRRSRRYSMLKLEQIYLCR